MTVCILGAVTRAHNLLKESVKGSEGYTRLTKEKTMKLEAGKETS